MSDFGDQQGGYCPCKDPKVKAKIAAINALMALGGGINPLSILSRLHGQAATRSTWRPLSIQVTGAVAPAEIFFRLHAYGIPTELHNISLECIPAIGIAVNCTDLIPNDQLWMADRTLRAMALHDGSYTVTSKPVWTKEQGSSLASAASGKIWEPWGVPAKQKSFGGKVDRLIGHMIGFTDKAIMNQVQNIRTMAKEREALYVKEQPEQAKPKRQRRQRPSRQSHRRITKTRNRMNSTKRKRART